MLTGRGKKKICSQNSVALEAISSNAKGDGIVSLCSHCYSDSSILCRVRPGAAWNTDNWRMRPQQNI